VDARVKQEEGTPAGGSATLVTVVAESTLERSLIGDLDRLGIGGYTISDARGRGGHGLRGSGWEHASNIRLEVLCSPGCAGQLINHLRRQYEKDFAMTIWSQTVNR
jgi:hypothetical protein